MCRRRKWWGWGGSCCFKIEDKYQKEGLRSEGAMPQSTARQVKGGQERDSAFLEKRGWMERQITKWNFFLFPLEIPNSKGKQFHWPIIDDSVSKGLRLAGRANDLRWRICLSVCFGTIRWGKKIGLGSGGGGGDKWTLPGSNLPVFLFSTKENRCSLFRWESTVFPPQLHFKQEVSREATHSSECSHREEK